MNINFKSQNGISKIAIIIIVVIAIIGIIIFANTRSHKFSLEEASAYTKLRSAIAQSNVDGTGEMNYDDFYNVLGTMIRNENSNYQWFDRLKFNFIGKIADTSDYQVTIVGDGTYGAKFTVKKDNGEYYLEEFFFGPATISNGATFHLKQ